LIAIFDNSFCEPFAARLRRELEIILNAAEKHRPRRLGARNSGSRVLHRFANGKQSGLHDHAGHGVVEG
jgi:hypothetical protein